MSSEVQNMFGRIARRYDLANDVLSFGIHRIWRRKAVRLVAVKPGEKVLDLCTGTGDQAFALASRVGEHGRVFGLDFVPQMLRLASEKDHAGSEDGGAVCFMQGDATLLPFSDEVFDLVTISFGIRNVDDPLQCLREIRRVLRPGGRLMVLEFGKPKAPIFSQAYGLYGRYLMPRLGGLLTGDSAAYEYLPRTAAAFPDGRNFLELLRQANFECPQATPLLSGLAYIYTASNSSSEPTERSTLLATARAAG